MDYQVVLAELDSSPVLAEIDSSPLHIAFGVDKNYFTPMSVTIASISEHNLDLDVIFHVFAAQVSKDDRARFDLLSHQYGNKIEIHEIGQSFMARLANFPRRPWISEAAFIRLIIPEALKDITDRVLYIDSDVLCKHSLADLISMDMSGTIAAVVSDIHESEHCSRLDLLHSKYFNSGFLYINIDKWLSSDITELTVKIKIELDGRSNMADQDALNVALDGRVKYIEDKWNYQYSIDANLKKGNMSIHVNKYKSGRIEKLNFLEEAVFIHFIGRIKPWHFWMPHQFIQEYQKYLQLVPIYPTSLPNKPDNYKDMKEISKYLRKQGKYSDSVKWYFKYFLKKHFLMG